MSSRKILFFLNMFLLVTMIACGTNTSTPTPPTPAAGQTVPQYYSDVKCLAFGGKVINKSTGEWVNNRLVLLFLKGNEIARTTTAMRELIIPKAPVDYSNIPDPSTHRNITVDALKNLDSVGSNGIEDGIFLLFVENIYKLTISTLGIPSDKLFFESDYGVLNYFDCMTALTSWIYPIYEGETREYFIPSKNIRYVLKVLSGDISQLPAEIQQPGSVKLLEGNRLVAVNPNEPESIQPPSSSVTKFEQIVESVNELSRSIFPINNCGGASDIKQEITYTYLHEIIDETSGKLGIEIPLLNWLKIVAEVEQKYGTNDKEITTYSTTLTVPAGKNIEYTVLRQQTWESGVAVTENGGVEISAAYRILKNETLEVANSEQKSCP